ncbi:MAG: TRAP transporter substrate-binding protein [Rhodobacteraceae bacterium]|nr:TRAP transporter substrate-binding protein [Paracoccaceae bacterium]
MTSKILAAVAAIFLSVSAAAAADFTFKYGNSQPEAAARSQSMIWFEEQLEERSGGRIEVENFFGAVLGNEKEMFDQVTTGLLQGTRGGFFANASTKFNIFLLPFLVSGWDEMECLVRSDFAKSVQASAAENGYHVPATGISQGFRMYTNNVRPIMQVSDLHGLKIREPQTEFMTNVAQAIGSNVTAMAFSDVYSAFQRGTIDGQHNPPANIWNYKIYEVQKYLSVTRHMTGPDPLLVNKEWYDSMPADLQQIFDEVSVEALILSDKLARAAEDELLVALGEHMEVNELTAEGIATFQEAVQPVYQMGVDNGTYTAEDLEAARAATMSCG